MTPEFRELFTQYLMAELQGESRHSHHMDNIRTQLLMQMAQEEQTEINTAFAEEQRREAIINIDMSDVGL